MIRLAIPMALLMLGGCSKTVADLSCGDVAEEAIRISAGAIVAINGRTQTSKDSQRLVCHGTGFAKNGQEVPVRFQAFKGDDGDILIKYDTDEYQAKVAAAAKREEDQEQAQMEQQIQQTVDEEMRHGRAMAAADEY